MRILIVDNDANVRDVLCQQFERRGHTVSTAANVCAAVGVLSDVPELFDVIVADRDLGTRMTGVDFHRMLQPGSYRDKFVFYTTDVEGLPKRSPAVEKPDFPQLLAIVERFGKHG